MVVKKDVSHELVKKSNGIKTTDTSDLIEKTNYDAKIDETEKEVPHIDIKKSYQRS